MKIQNIIEQLTTHEIAKWDAIKQLSEIVDGFRSRSAIEGEVQEVATDIDDHGYIKIKFSYAYSKIKNKVRKGDKIDVMTLP